VGIRAAPAVNAEVTSFRLRLSRARLVGSLLLQTGVRRSTFVCPGSPGRNRFLSLRFQFGERSSAVVAKVFCESCECS
jgi:hypothetical protein